MKELNKIKALMEVKDDLVHWEELTRVEGPGYSYPIHACRVGSDDPEAPTLALFGGVHGLEKIGTQVIINYLNTLFKKMKWNKDIRGLLNHSRIVSIPLINPAGMASFKRSNPNGIDLMRNAPIDSEGTSNSFLLSGQRISNKLPWYRGEKDAPMEVETQATYDYVQKYIFQSQQAISLDVHSGFGMRDRLWYPWGKSHDPFPNIRQLQNLKDLLDESLRYHIYIVEPQSASYTIQGDLWDYSYSEFLKANKGNDKLFIPLTLEMGSWIWVKKNPLQIFNIKGWFNPIKAHRYERTMRRHLLLIDFLFAAVRNGQAWK